MDLSTFASSTPLHIGDYIVLRLSKPDEGWLSSEGLLDDECFATPETEDFHNCIWEIHVQNQYSATREYKEALAQSLAMNESTKESNSKALVTKHVNSTKKTISQDYLSQLHRAALNEQRLNDKLMNLKLGKPINYGDPIQLRHVKSHKFLTISSNILAREERENMKILVDSDGDSLSCIGFMPRYRYEREGQVLTNNSEVVVRVHERPGEYLHAAKHSNSGIRSEVNCSLESSYWTLILYQRVVDVAQNSIMAGQLVTLQDPDSLSCITLDNQVPGITERANVVMSPQFQARDLSADATVGTHLLWLVEKANVISGGPIGINTDSVTFRDLNTGLYMKIEEDGLVAVKQRHAASIFEFHNSQNASSFDSPYLEAESAVNLSCESLWIGNVAKTESMTKHGARCTSFMDKSLAVSLSVSAALFQKIGVNLHVGVQATMKLRKLLKVTEQYENGLSLIRELAQEVKNCNSVLESLCSFLALTDNVSKEESHDLLDGQNKEVITVRQNMVREQGLIDVLLDLLFVTETNIYDKIKEPIIKRESNARSSQRRIIQRKNSVNVSPTKELTNSVTDIMPDPSSPPPPIQRRSSFGAIFTGNKTNPASKTHEIEIALKSVSVSDKPKNLQELIAAKKNQQHDINAPDSDDSEDEEEEDEEDKEDVAQSGDAHLTVSQLIAQKCLKVLLCVIVDNFTNQLYVADRFPVLLAEVRDHRLAVLCVEEMLRENLTILQTKVRQREIDIFVGLLAQSEMSVTFLRLLQSTTSCPMGVDATQRMVANALFASPNNDNPRSRTTSDQGNSEMELVSKLGHSESRKSRSIIIDGSASANQRLIIQIVSDKSKKAPVEWGDLSLYCPVNPHKIVKGFNELADGLPEIWLTWKMKGKNGDFGMNQLFGYRDKVPLGVICSSSRKSLFGKNKPSSAFESISAKAFRRKATIYKKKPGHSGGAMKIQQNQTIVAIANHKSQVAEYFKTQLYLVADLCLDRNYVSIGMLEPLYEYEIMVAMLKNDVIPSSFKAPVCRVLRCLYVDRDPQIASKFPRYIRTSVSLNTDKSDEVALNSDPEHDAKQYKFALIQKLLSDYVNNDLDLSACDELSAESIELLQALVKFGFYEKVPQILDILKPLLKVLGNHQHHDKKKTQDDEVSSSDLSGESRTDRFASMKKWFSNRSKYQQITPDGEDEDMMMYEQKQVPWHKVWMERTDSLAWMICIFVVVILSVAMMIVQLFTDIDLSGFYISTTVFFGAEFLFRFIVNAFGDRGVKDFTCDPFNLLDAALVLLDIIMLSLGADGSQASASRATRSLRIIRIIRVARLIRAARLLRQIAAASNSQDHWEVPQRFRNIKHYEAKTIVNILKVLTMFYDRIQDNTLELGIQAFSQWCRAIKDKQSCDPVETFHKALSSEERLSSELSIKFDAVLLDAMMYADKNITHTALHLLMVHKSQKDLFFKVFEKIQIIYSPRIENICKQLTDMLRELKGLAEMFEIWSELESEDDIKSANRVKDILSNIRGYLIKRNEDRSLGIRSLTLVDEEVQNLLRNLDAMTTFMALQESLYDGGREELKPLIREILKACNSLICLFIKTSEANQTVAFKYLSWFVDRVDDDIDSTRVVRTIVEGNKSLIKQCSRRYLGEFAHKIVSQGRKPEYLDLFVGMTELSEVMGSHVLVVETEISTYLTGREWKKHILLWCATSDSPEYKERKAAMETISKQHHQAVITEEHLTPELRYHISILILLASCNLGPKLHAIYPVQDILIAIMDASTIFPVKRALGLLLIEVLKTSSDRVEKLDAFWLLLDHIALEMETLPSEMFNLSRNHPMRIQKGEWLEISANIITTFFQDFDLMHFLDHHHDKSNANGNTHVSSGASVSSVMVGGGGNESTSKHQPDAKITIERLHHALRLLIDQNAQKIGGAITQELIFSASVLHNLIDPDGQDIDAMENNDLKLKASRMQHQRTSVVYADLQQVYYRKQFKVFLRHIKESSSTSRDEVIAAFKNIPRVGDQVESDVRFEPLVKKLTTHFRSSIKRSPLSRSINEGAVETCVWFLKAMRHLFEDALGLTFEKLDEVDVGALVESKEAEKLRVIFNDQGITYLCLDLIAVGMEHSLYIEAIKLLVVMLLKSGGCQEIQKSIYLYLFETDSILFFELIKDMIESLKAWSTKETENSSPNGSANVNSTPSAVPEDIIVLNLLQGICEGSYMNNRDQIREQTGNSKMVNILESIATLVGVLSRVESSVHSKTTIKVLKTILRLVQGPCKGNQEQFVLHTELLISLNRMIRGARPTVRNASTSYAVASSLNQNFEQLKEAIIDALRGVIEGQPKTSLSFDRVTTTIDFSVLQVLVIPPEQEILETILGPQGLTPAQAKFLVLTETMKKSHGNVSANNGSIISSNNKSAETKSSTSDDISSVEVQWNNQIHVVYFPVPQFVKDLSTESKNKILETDQDFASRELKLMDFVQKIRTLHRESTHQQFLKRYGLSDLWTFKYYLARIMFINAIVMNCIILSYYGTTYHGKAYFGGSTYPIDHGSTTDDHATDDHTVATDDHHRFLSGSTGGSPTTGIHDHLFAPHEIQVVIKWLNIVQFGFAIVTVGIFCVVQVPVTFATEFEKYGTYLTSIFYTMLDPLPIWYFAYLVFTFLGLEVHQFFLSALLLDWIILDSTTQDLLLAVQYPARQLVATLVIILIMQNIFAGIMFVLFRHDIVTVPVRDMWDALKLCISYGFRGEYGIDHEMEPTLGIRMVLDITFYFIILSILRHIFFAIIVDTFGTIRELKYERESEAKNTCFVCGIERHDYDRIIPVGTTLGFAHHKNAVHNPLNYMAFIMNIWNQSQSEDSSLEIYVRECLKKGDVGWFPAGVHYEAHAAVAEAHAVDDHGHAPVAAPGGGGHGHGKKKHGGGGHGGGHGHTPGPAKDHEHKGHDEHHAMATPINRRGSNLGARPRSAFKEKEPSGGSDALLEKMHLMQQQLLAISKNMNSAATGDAGTPARYSLIDTSFSNNITNTNTNTEEGPSGRFRTYSSGLAVPATPVAPVQQAVVTRVENDPALVEAIANMNAAMVKMMGRIDEMEKKLSKSHKYLRHRIRMNNPSNARPLPHPLANSPLKMLMNKRKDDVETSGKSFNQDPSPQSSNGDERVSQALRTTQPPSASPSQKPVNEMPDGHDADDDEVPRPGAQKLENSDSESSLTSSRCTVNEDEDENENELEQPVRRPMPSQSPMRPTSAGVVRSSPAVPAQRERPQSANPKASSGAPAFSGPPKSLITNMWN